MRTDIFRARHFWQNSVQPLDMVDNSNSPANRFGLVLPLFDRPGKLLHPVAPHPHLLSSLPSRPLPFHGAAARFIRSQRFHPGTGGRG
jgi:hypothetical protein